MTRHIDGSKKWWALLILCLGQLMIVLDTTIVNVALPSIRIDLGFDEVSLAWVVNAYLLTFGGFLLLGGRLGDLFGHRKFFLIGITVFTFASLACGSAHARWFLIIARALQGIGGALLAAVSLSLMMDLFHEPRERTKAMGFFGFVAAGGGSLGVLLGGLLTGSFHWHWIFLVNIPVGIVVFIASLKLLPSGKRDLQSAKHVDYFGAMTITSALMIAVYAIVGVNQFGWDSLRTLGLLGTTLFLFLTFLFLETKVRAPLIPLAMFKLRNIATSNIIGILWAAGMFAWFFLSALYLQLILHYTPLQVGLSFLPANLIMAAFSVGISAKLVLKFGIKKPLFAGLTLVTLGLLWFARVPVEGKFLVDVLPGMILFGFGAGMAFNPLLLAAMSDAKQEESGLASGLVNTSFMMGGALGLALLASVANLRTRMLVGTGVDSLSALTSGYHMAFLVGSVFAAVASTIAAIFLRPMKKI